MKHRTNKHCKFRIKYHIILVCKYRKQMLVGQMGFDMENIIRRAASKYDIDINALKSDKDHVHLLVDCVPKWSPLGIVSRLKQISTFEIWNLHGLILRNDFWKERTFWSDGYFVSTVGDVSSENVAQYIEDQGQKQPRRSSPTLKRGCAAASRR